MGRFLEAAEIYVNNGNMLKAVKTLIDPATYSGDHARPAIEYLLAGLRSELTFGALPESCPTVPRLLGYVDRLEKSVMTEQEIDEASFSNPLDRRLLHRSTSSSRCLKRFGILIARASARSPRLSLRKETIRLRCCAWTISSRPPSNYEIAQWTRFMRPSVSSSTTSSC